MKDLTLLFILFFSGILYAEAQIEFSEEGKADGKYYAMVFTFDGVDAEMAGDIWKDFTKEYKAKAKYDRKTEEHFSDDAEVPFVSENTIDITAVFLPYGDQIQGKVWMNLGGAYLQPELHPNKQVSGKLFVERYLNMVKVHIEEEKLQIVEEELKEAEKELKKAEKDMEKTMEDIQDMKDEIVEKEKELEELKGQKPGMKQKIESIESKKRDLELKIQKLKQSL